MRHWMEKKASVLGEYDYEIAFRQHQPILAAIEAHDAQKAQVALYAHLESVRKQLTTLLTE